MRDTFAAGLWVFAQSVEKHGGYDSTVTVREQIRLSASVPGLKGVELIAPAHVSRENLKDVKSWLEECDLTPVSVNPYVWTEDIWRRGAFTSPDPKVRRAAIDTAKLAIEMPHYACYPNFVRFCGGVPVAVPCDPASGWTIDPDAVRRALTPRTRAIVMGSPANPTGAVQPREVMQALAALGVPLVSDEVYDGLVYDGAHATSVLEVAGDAEVYVLDGFSKRYAITGFRLGYAIVPRPALRPLQVLVQNLFISAAEFVQRAGLAALAHGEPTVQAMRTAYARRRDLLVSGLRELGYGVAAAPQGAFYVLADARRFDSDSRRLASRILEQAHVAVTPGIDFGAAGEGFLRFCYANSDEAIAEALARMGRVLA